MCTKNKKLKKLYFMCGKVLRPGERAQLYFILGNDNLILIQYFEIFQKNFLLLVKGVSNMFADV